MQETRSENVHLPPVTRNGKCLTERYHVHSEGRDVCSCLFVYRRRVDSSRVAITYRNGTSQRGPQPESSALLLCILPSSSSTVRLARPRWRRTSLRSWKWFVDIPYSWSFGGLLSSIGRDGGPGACGVEEVQRCYARS